MKRTRTGALRSFLCFGFESEMLKGFLSLTGLAFVVVWCCLATKSKQVQNMTVQTLAILKPSLMGVTVKPPHQDFSHIFTLLAELLPRFSQTLSGTELMRKEDSQGSRLTTVPTVPWSFEILLAQFLDALASLRPMMEIN